VGKTAESWLTSSARSDGVQLVVLGEGDPLYHRMLQDLQARHPDRVGLTLGFDEVLAHQIEAGADIFLMPSEYEPSGLNQLYSLKYGTVPVVRATGGLADTIVDATPENLAAGRATGFSFVANYAGAFLSALERALDCYRQHADQWLQIMQTGMRQDWSWDHSAIEYEKLYSQVCRGIR
jgi:starch synthase